MTALPRSVSADLRVRAAYAETAGIYRIIPRVVAVPEDVQDVVRLLEWARRTGTTVTPRGAGSGIPGNALGTGMVMDLRQRMPRVLEVDAAARTALTSANITHAELNAEAAKQGLRLPPDPSSSQWATLGGMVVCNAAGARTVRHGPVRPWVQALEIVTADGEVGWIRADSAGSSPSLAAVGRFDRDAGPAIQAAADAIRARFPRVRKNTAGYALDHWLASESPVDLVTGSEGTLAIVVSIRWRLAPVAGARTGLRVALRSLDDLEEAVQALVACEPSAVELLDGTFLRLLETTGQGVTLPGADAVLLVEFERPDEAAARHAVNDAVRAVTHLALETVTATTPEEEQRIWSLRHAASPILARLPDSRRSLQVIEDGCVPLPRLGEYVRAVRDAAATEEIEVVIFGHAGDGHVHVNALPDLTRPDWRTRLDRLYREVSGAVIALGGTPSGEHGDGRLRGALLEPLYGAAIVNLFRGVKTAFDPLGILNPGVKLDPAAQPLARLKVGPDADPLPDDIAAGLREIERTGGYARSRLALAGRDPA
ncbi:MAG: FAD-binding oxidoreductase [Gemmatimonadota bacterium]|nr:FAD-binding oxidoreductase [Gemmatimonadota bacterium]MDH4347446.1 FAD-binding oxidoreductase [Gemmatimonadota bacterium]